MSTRRTSVLAVVAIPVAAALTACSSSGNPIPSGATQPGSATPTTTTSVHHESRAAKALTHWYLTAIPPLHRINNAIVLAQHAVHRDDRSAVRSACAALQSSVTRFDRVPAAPDRAVRVSLARAMSHFGEAATDCLSGDLTPAGFLVIQGQHAVRHAGHRVDVLTRTP